MGRAIIPTPSFTEVRVADLDPTSVEWISDDGVMWHRVLRLDLDSPAPTISVGDTDADATTLPCDPGGHILRLAPRDHPRH